MFEIFIRVMEGIVSQCIFFTKSQRTLLKYHSVDISLNNSRQEMRILLRE